MLARDPATDEERFARVKVPEGLPRFVVVGERRLVPVEDVIAHRLDTLFPGMEILEHSVFRVTRDADMELSDDADDLLEAVRAEIRRRRFGDVVRLEVEASMSTAMLDRLRVGLGVGDTEIYAIDGLLDLADAAEIAELDRPDLKDKRWRPITQSRLRRALDGGDIFAEIARGDILVHHPYESFATSYEQFIRSASTDPAVRALKTTVYRTSDESPIVPSLVTAAESGKQSVCLVELKARFDERRNIEWAHALEQAGVHVVYGFADLKIHMKTTLVVRKERNQLRRYVHIGTGNYHSVTARTYEDVGIFTADEAIAADVADLFNFLTGFGQAAEVPQAPRRPTDAASATRGARPVRRVGSGGWSARRDPAEGERPDRPRDHRRARAGGGRRREHRHRRPQHLHAETENERIRVRSVVGRFLEHSRVFVFHAGDESHYLIGSADLS